MLTLLNFGLLADLVLTPAIMAGPLGRFFSKWWFKPKQVELPAQPHDPMIHSAEDSATIPGPHMPQVTAPQTASRHH